VPDMSINAGRHGSSIEDMPEWLQKAYNAHPTAGPVLWWSQRSREFEEMSSLQYASLPLTCACCMLPGLIAIRKKKKKEGALMMVLTETAIQLFEIVGGDQLEVKHQRLYEQIMTVEGTNVSYSTECSTRVASGIRWRTPADTEQRIDGSTVSSVRKWIRFDDAAGEVNKAYKLMTSISTGNYNKANASTDNAPAELAAPAAIMMQRGNTTPQVV